MTERLKIAPEAPDRYISRLVGVNSSFAWMIRHELIQKGVLRVRCTHGMTVVQTPIL